MITLKNNGEIELDVITTMGVSVKDDEDSIGYFGTGLKYAIAVFLREQIDFSLYVGENQYYFFTEEKTIRGKSFRLCKMQGMYDSVDLGFTTDLGKNWNIWKAYRELESNCRDEHGVIDLEASEFKPDENTTSIVIKSDLSGHDIESIFIDRLGKSLLFKNDDIEIYDGESHYIYYNGIRAYDIRNPSLFTYNILRKCSLTEDRTLCYSFEVDGIINDAVARLDNKEIIKPVVTAPRDKYESRLNQDIRTSVKPGSSFLEVCEENKNAINTDVKTYIKSHEPKRPLTPEESKQKFISELKDFCASHNVEHEIDIDGYVTIIACHYFNGV